MYSSFRMIHLPLLFGSLVEIIDRAVTRGKYRGTKSQFRSRKEKFEDVREAKNAEVPCRDVA
jgi:hypothetical protein